VPSGYQDNLQRFYVVHPGLYLRSLLTMMGPFTTGGFWEKLVRARSGVCEQPRAHDMTDLSLTRAALSCTDSGRGVQEYIDRVEFLWEAIPRSQCRFHDFVVGESSPSLASHGTTVR
jgi:hypothetical protein